MNILFAALSICNGGVAQVCRNLTKGFTDKGYNVYAISVFNESTAQYIYTWKFDAPYRQDIRNRIQVERLHDTHHFDYVILANPELPWIFSAISVLKDKAKLIGHLHSSPFGMYARTRCSSFLPLSSLFIRKIIFHVHALRLHRYYKELSKSLDHMVLLSPLYYNELLKLAYFRPDKVSAIANPILLEEKQQFEKENTVLYVGRISIEKRIGDILHIWEDVSKELSDWNLKIVGYGTDLAHWKDYVKKKKLDNIHFEGFQQPKSYYNKSKIIILTSMYEGLPMVLIEGMYFGCVPIAYDSFAAIGDIIDAGENGCVVSAFNRRDFENTLICLAKNSVLWSRMSMNAEEKSKKFSLKNIIDDWDFLLSKL